MNYCVLKNANKPKLKSIHDLKKINDELLVETREMLYELDPEEYKDYYDYQLQRQLQIERLSIR